jgi:hypothetical protein
MATDSLAAALAAFQAELPRIHKDASAILEGESKATGKKFTYGYKYAGLDNIVGIVLPLLGKHGLAFTSFPMLTDNGFVLHYQLLHASGGVLAGAYPLPDPTRTKPQAVGSAITYARRYALCAVTGIAPDEDDDAAEAERDYQPEVRADGSATEAEQMRMTRGAVPGTQRLNGTPPDDPWYGAPRTDMTPREELPGTASRDQLNHLFGLFDKLGLPKDDKQARLDRTSEIAGRTVKSSASLSMVEARKVADVLDARLKEAETVSP